MSVTYTPIDDIPKIRDHLAATFKAGKLLDIAYRKEQILQVGYMIKDNIAAFENAYKADLGRHAIEAQALELGTIQSTVLKAYNSVETWAKPDRPAFNILFAPMAPKILKAPKGVVLIIGPFNYPLSCSISYMVGAIAAGNTAVVKLSELCPNIATLTSELLPKYVDPDVARIVNGAIPETTKLLEQRWDHIIFTGSPNVGKVVSAAAAKHLTPVTLELGGQCPVVIDSNVDFKVAAKRVLWAKMANAGQTCVTCNHVFIKHEDVDRFAKELKEVWDSFYPQGAAASENLSKMVSENHFNRVKGLLDGTKGEIVCGGQTDLSRKMIEPTVVKNVTMDDSLLSQEIFGPLLPIVGVKDFDEAIEIINAGEHPLALYVFTNDASLKQKFIDRTQSGALSFNELLVHAGTPGLPFGGVGHSGNGGLNGKFTFDTLTHLRASIDAPTWTERIMGWRYPPYTDAKQQQAAKLLSVNLPARPGSNGGFLTSKIGWIAAGVVGVAGALLWRKKPIAAK